MPTYGINTNKVAELRESLQLAGLESLTSTVVTVAVCGGRDVDCKALNLLMPKLFQGKISNRIILHITMLASKVKDEIWSVLENAGVDEHVKDFNVQLLWVGKSKILLRIEE